MSKPKLTIGRVLRNLRRTFRRDPARHPFGLYKSLNAGSQDHAKQKPRRNLTEQMLEVLNDLIHAASIRWRPGAIYGQLAGAFCGKSEIPLGWIERLAMHEFIREMADALFSFSIAPNSHHF